MIIFHFYLLPKCDVIIFVCNANVCCSAMPIVLSQQCRYCFKLSKLIEQNAFLLYLHTYPSKNWQLRCLSNIRFGYKPAMKLCVSVWLGCVNYTTVTCMWSGNPSHPKVTDCDHFAAIRYLRLGSEGIGTYYLILYIRQYLCIKILSDIKYYGELCR